jgi:hypothetical protein
MTAMIARGDTVISAKNDSNDSKTTAYSPEE